VVFLPRINKGVTLAFFQINITFKGDLQMALDRDQLATQILSSIVGTDRWQEMWGKSFLTILDDIDHANPSSFEEGVKRISGIFKNMYQSQAREAYNWADALISISSESSEFATGWIDDIRTRAEQKNSYITNLKYSLQQAAWKSGTQIEDLWKEVAKIWGEGAKI